MLSIDQLAIINRWLGVALIALYLVLGIFFVPYLLPTSSVAILMTGSDER
jgi:hypothetical protein